MIEIGLDENQAEWIRDVGDDKEKWQKSEEMLEIRDYYRVWVKSPDDVPDERNAIYDREGGPADNHYFYEVPFQTSTEIALDDGEDVDKAVKKQMQKRARKDYPERVDLVDVGVPEKDLRLVDKAQTQLDGNLPLFGSDLKKSNPSILMDIESSLTLLNLYKMLYEKGDSYSAFLNQIQKELGRRGIYSFEKVSKARRYIDSPEEAPEWAEVQEGPQGGQYYETGDSPTTSPSTSTGDVSEISSQVEEATDATVDLSGFNLDQAEQIGSALKRAGERGWTERVEVIESEPPEWLEEQEREKAERAFGFFDENYKTLYFNPDKVNEEDMRDAEETWMLTDASAEGLVQHEVGHARHYHERDGTPLPDDWETVADQIDGIKDADMLKYIAFQRPDDIGGEPEGISKLAQVSPMEFVAETHAALAAGQEVDEGVRNLYSRLDGPEVEQPMERSEKAKSEEYEDLELPSWIQEEVELIQMLNRGDES